MKKHLLYGMMLLLPVAAWGQNSGTCGDNLTWRLGESYVIFIEGTGAMTDFSPSNRPWQDYTVYGLVVGDGVTTLGDYAFDGSYSDGIDLEVRWAVLPASLTEIGSSAFDSYYDQDLNTLYLHAPQPPALGSMTVADDFTCYVPEASLAAYLADGSWNRYTLQAMPTQGTLTGGVTWAYADGTLTLGGAGRLNSYGYYDVATNIPWAAYYPYIERIVVGSGINGWGHMALGNLPALKQITFERTTPLEYNAEVFTNSNTGNLTVSVPSPSLQAYREAGYGALGTLTATPGTEAGGTCGDALAWSIDEGTLTISGTGAMDEWASEADVPWHDYRNVIYQVVLPAGLTSIGAYAFADMPLSYWDIVLPAENQLARAHHSSFRGVEFPYGQMIYFGSVCYGMAFPETAAEGEYRVGEVVLQEGTTYVMDEAFCTAPIQVTDKTTTYNPFAETDYLVIPRSVEALGEKAFYSLEGLPVLTVPESVAQVGDSAFAGCEDLERVTWMPATCSLGQGVFHPAVEGVEFGKTVRQIPAGIFAGNTAMASVAIPHEVTGVGDRAFYRCTGLSQAAIGAGVTSLGEGAFTGCTELTNILCYAVEPPAAPAYCFLDVPITASVQIPCGCIPAYEAADEWTYFWSFTEIIAYTATGYSTNEELGTVSVEQTCAEATFRAEPVEGCRFVAWSDGNTDNPRIVPLSADVELLAEFRAETTGLDQVWDDGTEVYTHGGTLHIRGNDREATVYDTTGRTVYQGFERAIALDRSGLYIIEIDGRRMKVVL